MPKKPVKSSKSDTVTDKQKHENYIAYLQKAVDSPNFKAGVSSEEYIKAKDKLSKAKTKWKLLWGKP